MGVYETDSTGYRIIGYNTPIQFYDPTRTLRAEIFLQSDNKLNVGGLSGGAAPSTGTVSAHSLGDTSLHIGTLADTQAPQFLKIDGTRSLSGNWDAGAFIITAAGITLDNTGLHILDTNASHDLIITPGSDLTADRIFTITTGDAARTLDLGGNLTISATTSITGGGTVALGGFTLTVPATGTAAMLNQANSFTLINPLTTIAESWIGPSALTGVYFKGGRYGLGTITPDFMFELSGSVPYFATSVYSNDTYGAAWYQNKARGTKGAPNIIVSGDTIGVFQARGWDGAAWRWAGGLSFVSTGTVGAGRVPSYIEFSTHPNAAAVAREVMRLTASGTLNVGTTQPLANNLLGIQVDASAANRYVAIGQDATHSVQLAWSYNAAAANAYGYIDTYGGNNPFVLQPTAGNVLIGTTTDNGQQLQVYKVGTQLKLSGGAADYMTVAVAANGATTFTTIDSTGALANIILAPDGDVRIDADLVFVGAQSITTTSDSLTIAPTADLNLTPGGTARVRTTSGVRIQSDNYASQTTGWGISYAGSGDFRYLYADELHAKAFIADLEQALAGGQIISKSVAPLAAIFTIPVAGVADLAWTRATTTATVTHTAHGKATNDLIYVAATSDAAAITLGQKTITVVDVDTYTFVCLDAGAASGTITVNTISTLVVESFKGFDTFRVFVDNDIIRLRQFDRTGTSLSITNTWGTVVWVSTDTTNKTQTYRFLRSVSPDAGAGTAGQTIGIGVLALDYGTTGNGFLESNAIDGAMAENAPYHQIVSWATHPHSGLTVRTRLGNLKGIFNTANEYGLYAGAGITDADQYLRISNTAVEAHNLPIKMYDGASVTMQLSPTAPSFAMGSTLPSAFGTGTGLWMGKDTLYKWRVGDPAGIRAQWDGAAFSIYDNANAAVMTVDADGGWLSNLAISSEFGQQTFTKADGLTLLGPGCSMISTSWTTLRGQAWTISNVLHPVPSRWPGTQAHQIEVGTVNRVPDPVFGHGDLTEWTVYTNTPAYSTARAFAGTASCYVNAIGANMGLYKNYVTATGGSWTAQAMIFIESYTAGTIFVQCRTHYTDTTQDVTTTYADYTKVGEWQQIVATQAANGAKTVDYVMILIASTTTPTSQWYFDAAQLENLVYPTSLCYGDQAWSTWASTAHASASTRVASHVSITTTDNILNPALGSMSLWFQMPLDAGSTGLGGNGIFRWHDDWNTESFAITLSPDMDYIYVRSYTGSAINISINCSITGRKKGDWIHFVLTMTNAGAGTARVYIDGILAGTDATYVAPTIVSNVYYLGFMWAYLNAPIAEFATFNRVLTAAEVGAIYQSQAPLTDQGATDTPGIYILDGKFRLSSSTSDERIEIIPTEIAGYNGGVKQFYLQASDGKMYAGAGNVCLNATGIEVTATTGAYSWNDSNAYKFISGATVIGGMIMRYAANDYNALVLDVKILGAAVSSITLLSDTVYITTSTVTAGFVDQYLYIGGGLHVGGSSNPGNDNLIVDGTVGVGLTPTANMLGVSIEAGLLTLKERTTPTADVNYGKVYTKADNKLYFQDGAGAEHVVAYV